MKTKLLFTIVCIFFLATYQVFSEIPVELNQKQEMLSETQIANGNVLTVKVHSQGIANNMLGDSEYRRVSIYLPPGYDENETSNYPVIYMLSDFNGSNEDWFQTLGSIGFINKLDKLINSGNIKPAIMVFPDGKNSVGGSWYTNSNVSGNWEDFIVRDLVNYIDQNFRTLPFATSRGIAGKGMGGYGALKLATLHPDVFSAVYSLNAIVDLETIVTHEHIWSSSIKIASQATKYPTSDEFANHLLGMAVAFSPNQNKSAIPGNLPKTETGEIVNDVFENWLSHDPLQLINTHLEKLKTLKAITVDCSTSNVWIMLNGNYSDALNNSGVTHNFSYFDGNENIDILKRITDVMLPMFSENLAHSLLEFEAKSCYTYSDILKVKLITDGNIYVVPQNNEAPKLSMISNKVVKTYVPANKEIEIPLVNLSKGIYKIYGVSKTGYTGESQVFGLNGGVPLVKICVTDSYTGEKIETCQMTVNDAACLPNPDGDYCFDAEGKISICAGKENYGLLTKSVMIYTDTTLNISLVKDSYLQVVERRLYKPVFEAMVTQNNKATLTDRSGITTVQNLQNGILECRIFKAGYFTEIVNIPLDPGKTAIVELTKKKANVFFYVIGNEGPKFGVYVNLGEFRYYSQENGKVSFIEMDTRNEYTYSVSDFNYEEVQGSFFLEHDTVINIFLQPKENKSGVIAKNGQLTTDAQELSMAEILVYPNPAKDVITIETDGKERYAIELLTQSGSVVYQSKIEGTLHRINLSNLSNGVYFVTVKTDNFYYTRKIMKL